MALHVACMQALHSSTMTSAWQRRPSQTCRLTGSRPSRPVPSQWELQRRAAAAAQASCVCRVLMV